MHVPVVHPQQDNGPQTERPQYSSRVNKPIPPHIWKQKMDNLQPVHGGSLVSHILLLHLCLLLHFCSASHKIALI